MVTVTVALGSLSPKASNQSIQYYHHPQVKENNISNFDLEDLPLHKKYLSIVKRTEKEGGREK